MLLLLLGAIGEERLTIDFGFDKAIDLEAFADSLYALEALWGEFEPDTKLALTTVRSGSAIADFVPYAMSTGVAAVAAIGVGVTISDFVRKTGKALRAFAEIEPELMPARDHSSISDDLQDLIGAVAQSGGSLSLKHTHKVSKNRSVTVTEATFDAPTVQKIFERLDHGREAQLLVANESRRRWTETFFDVELYLDQISKDPGKQAGRSRDRGIVPQIDSKPRPLFFASGSDLKDRILGATENPMTTRYIVDVVVNRKGKAIESYEITGQHHALLLE